MPTVFTRLLLLPPLLLAACGDLPQPFAGQPGLVAARLARPPPARLAVPPPTAALLSDSAGDTLSGAVADALVAQEVPAVAHEIRPGDWQLAITAELAGGAVIPTYTVKDERGRPQGSMTGVPVPAVSWANGDPDLMKQAAAAVAPKIADLLVSIDASRKRNDPQSVYNRPARVAVPDVTGAPGDGNQSLALQMRRHLPKLGDVVLETPFGADFTVAGHVRTAPGAGGTTRVEIQWLIEDAAGHDLGRVVQINEVPAGSLGSYWGDIAMVVAEQAAGGVQDVILRQSGKRPPAASGAAAPLPEAGPNPPAEK